VVDDPIRVRQLLGYQTTDTGLYARLTPREFLSYFGSLHDMPSARIKERSQALVREFDMESFADRPCGTLSTGQKQRVSLARTLLHDPPVVVLDEPTNGLDILSSHFVVEALRKAAADGRAVLFSSHIMSDVELASDRLVVIHQGEVVAAGTIAELNAQVGEPTLSRTFLRLVRSPAHTLLSPESALSAQPTAAAIPSNPEAA
jgi:sodium transport system ATP-binding protein